MRKNLLWALLGFVTGLWWMERARRNTGVANASVAQASPTPRRDRALEDMSEYYRTRRMYLTDYDPLEIADHLDRLALELIQPGMSHAEAAQVADALSEIARGALVYDASRKIDEKRDRLNREDGLGWGEDR